MLLVGFLAPIIGGQVSLDALPLSGALSGILGGPELPFGTRALLGCLLVSSIVIALARRKVVQIPSLKLGAVAIVLPLIVGASILSSEFAYQSYATWLTWVVYAICLFVPVASLGRRIGIKALLWALTAGGTAVALKGIQEYAGMRAIEPGHRIFGDWNNPNALAGVLSILVPLSLGLCVSTERLESLGSGLCAGLMTFALVLTQSKGGLIVTALAVVTVALSCVVWKGGPRTARVVLPMALAVLLTFGAVRSNTSASGGSPVARVIAANSTQDQSAGFRTLLWKGALTLTKDRPLGWGIGTYRYESARPGLTEQTFHAHQTWLQLAAEGGIAAALALILLTGMWLKTFLSGAKNWPWPEAGWRAGVLGASVAAAADGCVESNLSYLGIGIVLFLVLGAGLQLSSDGSVPEVAPKTARWSLISLVCIVPLMLLHTALVEYRKSDGLFQAAGGNLEGARADLELARTLAPVDGETQYLSASIMSKTPAEQLSWLNMARQSSPNTKYLRAYARAASRLGKVDDASSALDKALETDPNNLAALELKYKLLVDQGKLQDAIQVAQQLVEVEGKPYFAIRAIPELVPLETYDARVFLASHISDRSKRAELLIGALRGYATYMQRTAPMVSRFVNGGLVSNYLGHDKAEVEETVRKGLSVASELRKIYGESGNQTGLAEVESLSSGLKLD